MKIKLDDRLFIQVYLFKIIVQIKKKSSINANNFIDSIMKNSKQQQKK